MPDQEDREDHHLATLGELENTQEQIVSYQGLLRDLPEIFERKFNERLKPLLDRNQQLREERALLLQQLHQGLPAIDEGARLLPPASTVLPEPSGEKRLWQRRLLWFLALAFVGGAFGVQLSKQIQPGIKKQTSPAPKLGYFPRVAPPSRVEPHPHIRAEGWRGDHLAQQTTKGPTQERPSPATPMRALESGFEAQG